MMSLCNCEVKERSVLVRVGHLFLIPQIRSHRMRAKPRAHTAIINSCVILVILSEQLAPFLLLSITANIQVVVVHGIQHLIIPLVQTHCSLKNQVLAFIGEAHGVSGFPMVVKLNKEDFEASKNWSHPKMDDCMNVIEENTQVLPVPEISNMVVTSKFIPILLFLVLTFMDLDKEMDVIKVCQVFYVKFFEKASKQMQEDTVFIMKFLLAAMGYDEMQEQWSDQVCQLAVSMEGLTLDLDITHWASVQFGEIRHRKQCTWQFFWWLLWRMPFRPMAPSTPSSLFFRLIFSRLMAILLA